MNDLDGDQVPEDVGRNVAACLEKYGWVPAREVLLAVKATRRPSKGERWTASELLRFAANGWVEASAIESVVKKHRQGAKRREREAEEEQRRKDEAAWEALPQEEKERQAARIRELIERLGRKQPDKDASEPRS